MHDLVAQVYLRRSRFGKRQWDWRIISRGNGRIVATDGGQGFTEANDASEAVRGLFAAFGGTITVEHVD